jgi:hypothetical protein
MKKILSIMLAGALTAGVAFADVHFSYTGTAIVGGSEVTTNSFKSALNSDGTTYKNTYSTSESFNNAKLFDTVARNDCFNLSFGDQVNGAVIDWDVADNALAFDSYYGWMTFGLPVGNLQVTTGKWASRYVDRVNQDAGDLDAKYYETFKPGVIIGVASYVPVSGTTPASITTSTGTFASDIDNLTSVNGTKQMSTVLVYTLDGVLPGKLTAKFGLVDASLNYDLNDDDKADWTYYNKNSTDKTTIHAGFIGEVGYAQDSVIKVNAVFKNIHQDAYAFGLFVSPLMIEKLSATAGFSYGSYKKDETTSGAKDGSKYNEWGIDLRARYAITDKIAVTTMNNISKATYDHDTDGKTERTAMWNMLSVSAKAGDNISFLATVQNTNNNFDAAKCTDSVFAITPVCMIQASAKAKVTAGFDIRWTDMTPFANKTTEISLPIYFSFSL